MDIKSKELISSFCKGLLTWDEGKSNKSGCVVTESIRDSFFLLALLHLINIKSALIIQQVLQFY